MRVDFVIVTALEEERDAVLSKLKGWRKLPPTKADVRVYFHAYLPVVYPDGMRAIYSLIVVCLSGMGRVEAVNTAKDAIVRWNPVYVFLVGIAGGFEQNDARLGHVLVPDQIFDYELQKIVDVPRWKWFGWLLGKVSKEIYRPSVHRVDARFIQAAMNYLDKDWLKLISAARPGDGEPMRLIGPMASGDKVIASRSQLKKLLSLCPKLMGLEMEASGAVSACFQAASSPGFVMVRGVSDLTDEKKDTPNCAEWRGYASDVAAAYAIGLLNSGPIPIETAITQFSKNTDRAKKAARIHIPGLPEPIPRDEVDNIDARWLEHVKEENELQSFFKVDDGVSREIERIGSGWGCRLIIDQLDSVVGFPVSTVLTQLATDCSTHEGVEVIVISRRREGHEAKTLTPLLDSGFVELESRNLSETTSATVLAKIGIVSPPPIKLIERTQNLLNLELGAKIKEENESFDFNNIEDEIDLWEKYAEALAASASNGEMLLAELGKLAKEALNSDDGSFILPFPLTRVHTHLDSWVVIKAEYGRSYSFAHEKLQDYFYAWDATERRLLPAVLYHAFHTSSACPRQAHSYSKFSRATWLATAEEKSRLSISHVFLGCL